MSSESRPPVRGDGLARGLAWGLAAAGLALLGVVVWTGVAEPSPRGDERPGPPGVEAPTASDAPVEARAGSSAGTGPAEVALASSAIVGQVVEREVGPLSEGRLEVACVGAGRLADIGLDEAGRFALPACAEGPSCVRLVHPGADQPIAWELEGPRAGVELEAVAAAALTGVVRSPDGERVADARVYVTRAESGAESGADGLSPASVWSARTDADGEFGLALPGERPCDRCDGPEASGCRFGEPALDGVRVLASASGHAAVEVTLASLPSAPLVLTLAAPGPALTGQVLDPDDVPFDARTRVLARSLARPLEQHAAVVGEDGRFELPALGEGAYALRAIRDERELARAEGRSGERVALRSELDASGDRLTITLVDSDGESAVGIRVDGGPFAAAITDADGVVDASAVLPGEYRLRVRRGGCEAIQAVITLERADGDTRAAGWRRRVQAPEDC